ncbi:hypothetical protein CGCA056_v012308 [Colletotrichum aenigma]|uniref:uncharacterized protein n=1 Tax=Colletotrichum aenigma TaxID=1215731 RepID=UPI001872F40A|nr:uncharacterized protein CGCA056_v012308 [Colletotrichum aenigma]KAF5512499.1 hypothetical protein CGCA056_v012308 [Colletotrichum aenigma]
MTTCSQPNCKSLESLKGFDDYLRQVRNVTQFKQDLLANCSTEICGAIWGESNPDISGIGVSIGYTVEAALGLFFAAAVLSIRQRQGPHWEFAQLACAAGFEAFFGSAIYFAISLEVAAIYMLVNKDFVISTAGLGATEAQIIWAVSVVCILPLLYPMALLSTRLYHPESERQKLPEPSESISVTSADVRLTLFSLLTVLFFYPFLSQCIHNWGPSRVGEGKGADGETLATDEEWNQLEILCLDYGKRLSDTERKFLAVFELVSSVFIILFALWLAVEVGARRMAAQDRAFGEERCLTRLLLKLRRLVSQSWKSHGVIRAVLLLTPSVLVLPLLWGIFRLREIQSASLERAGRTYTGNEWGFGQVVGIIIFAPVVTEMAFAAWAARSLLTI